MSGSARIGAADAPVVTCRIRAYGIVQGVGFRPTVSRHATASQVAGTVCNKGPYVEMYAQGTQAQVDRFVELLREEPPRRATIIKLDVAPVADAPAFEGFDIVESARTKGEIFVSPDLAICEDCKRELFDPADRRYLHPFINCTNCGPRLTILDALPYDRVRTSMGAFPMCPACESEYHSPASRRFDAQPVCCNDCGPTAYLLDRPERGRAAITEARRLIASGAVVAVKGIGGFHLCCDATNAEAVGLLRERKRRSAKPFAVMARDLAVAERECVVPSEALPLLDGHQKPILLLPRRATGQACEEVAPDNPKLGILLPYAPLQLLLFAYDDGIEMPDLLVMTSANESGAPICRDDEDARRELGPLCDAILSHDRLIRVRADDTVCDLYEGRPYMVRRSRGWAPLPLMVADAPGPRVLAVGGELKNAFCIGTGELFYPSPYVGDLADVRTVASLEETVARLSTLLEATPEVVACDLHPRYNSTVVAERMAAEASVPLVRVQHHYAHVVSCMAENDVSEPVIGISFDGTGYGTDGTVWGGEVLLSDWDGFERLGHIAPFVQAGGDASAREGWRIALALLLAWEGSCDAALDVARELQRAGGPCHRGHGGAARQRGGIHERRAAFRRRERGARRAAPVDLRGGGGHAAAVRGGAPAGRRAPGALLRRGRRAAARWRGRRLRARDRRALRAHRRGPSRRAGRRGARLRLPSGPFRAGGGGMPARAGGARHGGGGAHGRLLPEPAAARPLRAAPARARLCGAHAGAGSSQRRGHRARAGRGGGTVAGAPAGSREGIARPWPRERTETTMCVGLSAKVVRMQDGTALVDASGARREVSVSLLDNLEPGDYVMVHAGIAIAKITDEDEHETNELMEALLA